MLNLVLEYLKSRYYTLISVIVRSD